MIELAAVPALRDPVMIAAFEGWNDAGGASTAVLEHLARVWAAEPFAALDPEDYYDFQVNRPSVGPDDDNHRRVTWPTTRLLAAHVPSIGRDVVIVDGIEPSMRWRSYSIELLECAAAEPASPSARGRRWHSAAHPPTRTPTPARPVSPRRRARPRSR